VVLPSQFIPHKIPKTEEILSGKKFSDYIRFPLHYFRNKPKFAENLSIIVTE
jgi:hypothetical protein